MSTPRKNILVGFEKTTLMEFRKTMFLHGISPNEFFSFIVELVNTNDPRIEELIEDVKQNKIDKILKGEKVKYTADNLYDAIEQRLKK
jgi:hypothetical protein